MSLPFLKWPGGKRWLAPVIVSEAETSLTGRYFEPFVGSGAVFFRLQPQCATLSDLNGDLVNVYAQVRDRPEELIVRLSELRVTKKAYYSMRRQEPSCLIERAVRFLYLNRTAFGGIYRLNGDGRFNVPYGGGSRTHECLWKTELLRDASKALQNAELKASDFEAMVDRAKEGDVVYCDPTYTVAHENNGFIRYNEKNFSWEDQKRLAAACTRAAKRGAAVIVSNAYHSTVAKLYVNAQRKIIERKSLVSPKKEGRRTVHEYLFAFAPAKQ